MKCFLSMMLTRVKLVILLAVDQIFTFVEEGAPIQSILQVSNSTDTLNFKMIDF